VRHGGPTAATLVLLASAALVACSSDPVDRVPPVAETGQDGLGEHHVELAGDPDAPLAWVDGGSYLAVITRGSSSCPYGPGTLTVTGPQRLTVALVELNPGQDACTADLAPHVTVVEVPDGLDHTLPVTAVLDWGDEWPEDADVVLDPVG
jgi:hypothetical protein